MVRLHVTGGDPLKLEAAIESAGNATARDSVVPTGVPGLDEVLGGGIPRGRPCLVVGPPGSGKSVLGAQFVAEGSRNGEESLYVSFGEPAEELRQDFASFGWDPASVSILDLTGDPGTGDLRVPEIEGLLPGDDIRISLLVDTLRACVGQRGVRRLVLDSLCALTLQVSEAWASKRQVVHLFDALAALRTTSLVLCSTENPAAALAKWAARGVISLGERDGRRQLKVEKMRGAAHRLGEVEMRIARGGMQVLAPPGDTFAAGGALATPPSLLTSAGVVDVVLPGGMC